MGGQEDCRENLRCHLGRCKKAGQEGELCEQRNGNDYLVDTCEGGLGCRSNKCVVLKGEGEQCTAREFYPNLNDCQHGFLCHDNTCMAKKKVGESCNSDYELICESPSICIEERCSIMSEGLHGSCGHGPSDAKCWEGDYCYIGICIRITEQWLVRHDYLWNDIPTASDIESAKNYLYKEQFVHKQETACDSSDTCEEGSLCERGSCVRLRKEGEPCLTTALNTQCEPGLKCYDFKCVRAMALGEECRGEPVHPRASDCDDALRCKNNICAHLQNEGEDCQGRFENVIDNNPFLSDCGATLRCHKGKCVQPLKKGEDCFDSSTGPGVSACEHPLVCNATVFTCDEPKEEGEDCGASGDPYNSECAVGLECWFGKCRRVARGGESCGDARSLAGTKCERNFRCNGTEEGTCVRLTSDWLAENGYNINVVLVDGYPEAETIFEKQFEEEESDRAAEGVDTIV